LAVDVFLLGCGDTMNKIEKFGLFVVIVGTQGPGIDSLFKFLVIVFAWLLFYFGDKIKF
jgi:hypothetical protein